jgi:hypothetical protein
MTISPAFERRIPIVLRMAEVALGIATIGFVGYLLARQVSPGIFGTSAPIVRMSPVRVAPPPRVIPVLNDRALRIHAGEHVDTSFVVRDPRPCTLTGTVTGLAGGSRDVEVFLLDQAGYDDWHNGVAPRSVYFGGRAATVSLHIPLPERGRYYFLVSNRFSVFTDKLVAVRNVRVTCAAVASTTLP